LGILYTNCDFYHELRYTNDQALMVTLFVTFSYCRPRKINPERHQPSASIDYTAALAGTARIFWEDFR
jgi:hypothetical protein